MFTNPLGSGWRYWLLWALLIILGTRAAGLIGALIAGFGVPLARYAAFTLGVWSRPHADSDTRPDDNAR